MVNVTNDVVGAVIASSAAHRARRHGRNRRDHLELHVLARFSHGHREEPVLGLELLLREAAPERDAPDQRRMAHAEQCVHVHGDVGPAGTRRARCG